jgi:hypothetical protein
MLMDSRGFFPKTVTIIPTDTCKSLQPFSALICHYSLTYITNVYEYKKEKGMRDFRLLRSMLLWGFLQHRLVFSYGHFVRNLWVPSSRIKQSEKNVVYCFTLDDGTKRLFQNVINKLSIYTA